jgi:hypothetical protein
VKVVELSHPSDPRFLLVLALPERVAPEDLASWRYGPSLLFAPWEPDVVYAQPAGPGTDWVRP